ncbi:MAG: hypothetical protein ABR549_17145 [Mycobacteriales bacterium]
MIRRSLVAALLLTLAGGIAAPVLASADGPGVCVLGTNHSNGTRDGICVWIPTN